jgi:hypothetical protein
MKTKHTKNKQAGWATRLPILHLTFTAVFILSILAHRGARAASAPAGPVFTSEGKDRYVFDTGILRGEIRKDDLTLGLSSMVHIPSGTKLNGKYGVFSYYRVFTTNRRYGHAAWEWPSVSKLLPDGAVHIIWPAEPEHPFEMMATYRLSGDTTIDVETVVKAQKDLPGFEVFLASYFHEALPASHVYVNRNPKMESKPGFLAAEKSFGDWQMFPRAEDVLPIIRDGRWEKEPNPVKWAIMPCMAAPIGVRQTASAELAVVLMAPPEDCFAISTPYEGEGHYSMYLSLFGRDVRAGQTVKARSRLVVGAGLSDDQILALYKEYMKALDSRRASSISSKTQKNE